MRHDPHVDGDLVREALRPVLDDLERTCPGLVEPVPWDRGRRDDRSLDGAIWLRDVNGYGPIFVAQFDDLGDLRLQAAETVQEAAVEALWSRGYSAVWPQCPDHPDTHPLDARTTAGGLVWVCPRTARSICAVGRLVAN
jgi:hypothetical protein